MFTILFSDTEYDTDLLDSFDINQINNTSIVFTRCFNKKLLDKLYIKGLKVIYVYKDSIDFVPIDVSITNENILTDFSFKNPRGSSLKKTQSYGSVSDLLQQTDIYYKGSENQEHLQEHLQDKFQKTMFKESTKLIYAENREKYKQKMRQTSLSNKKSIEKKDKKKEKVPGKEK